ncbi:hypothetical protein K7432_014887, partial [Basidiobolus ranarum]
MSEYNQDKGYAPQQPYPAQAYGQPQYGQQPLYGKQPQYIRYPLRAWQGYYGDGGQAANYLGGQGAYRRTPQ